MNAPHPDNRGRFAYRYMCLGKTRYRTRKHAEWQRVEAQRREPGHHFSVYACLYSSHKRTHYHIGHAQDTTGSDGK